MYFTKTLLPALASALIMTQGIRADDCTEAPVHPVGPWGEHHDGGIPLCQTAWKTGLVVTGVEVWSNKFHIKGIQFTYSDGTKPHIQGNTDGDRHDFISWPADTPIRSMTLASNKDGNGLGLIEIEVGDQKLSCSSDHRRKDEVNIASGFLLGAGGEYGGYIHQWAPLFLGMTNGNAKIIDIRYDDSLEDINARQQGIDSMTLSEVFIKNSNPIGTRNASQSWLFSGSTNLQRSAIFSSTQQNTFGTSVELTVGGEIGVPFVANGGMSLTTGISYQYTSVTTKEQSESNTENRGWGQASTETTSLIEPGHAMHCRATAWHGSYRGGYTSTVQISVGGRDYTFEQHGEVETVSHSHANTECEDVLISNIPMGSNVLNAIETTGSAPLAAPPAIVKKRAVEFSS